ncbi:MAG: hypothetical protein ACYC99_08125 [Candidatus Geothermincolia bacterium]
MPLKIKKMKPKRQGGDKPGSVKLAWIVGAAGLCILLIAGIIIATSGNGKKATKITAQETSPGSSTPAAPASSAPTTPKLTLEQVQVPPLSIYRRRNPFEPLVNMDAAGTAASAPTGAGATASRVVRVPEQLRSGANPPPEVLSRAITLDGISKQNGKPLAKIRVGDQLFENIAVGQTFGEHYKLLSIGDDSSATILFGDERFTIFTGQSIYL